MFKVPENCRVTTGSLSSDTSDGNNGCFLIGSPSAKLATIVSDGDDWEHVSVSCQDRCPTWDEMNYIKDLFWSPEDLVVQFHPPKSEYINCHPYCLHLFRKFNTNEFCETPPKSLIGI